MKNIDIDQDSAVLGDQPQPSTDLAGDSVSTGEGAGSLKSGKARTILSWAITSVAVFLTLAFVYHFLSAPRVVADPITANAEKQADGAAIRLSPDQTDSITVEAVQKRMVAGEVKSPGKVVFNANQVSPVLAQFSGRLTRMSAEIGQVVKVGQILGSIETPDIVQPQADYQQALANVRTAQTTILNLTRVRERAERLVKVEAIPARELQQAQVDEKHAREDLERAEQAAASTRSRLQSLHFSDAEIKSLDGGSKALRREVPLTAPISGTVIERKAGIGQIVQPGGDPLFQIANLSTVWVNAEVYEDQLARLHIGLPATVEAPAYPARRFTARVDQIGSVVDSDKRTVAVRCILPNNEGELKPGMFVSVVLGGVSNLEAITVPATAVVTDGEKRAVFIESGPGSYEKREVTIGDEIDGTIVIKTGLSEGEKVVVKGGLLVAAEAGNGR
jgi:membrane fusion protein, heavy metal efflux system